MSKKLDLDNVRYDTSDTIRYGMNLFDMKMTHKNKYTRYDITLIFLTRDMIHEYLNLVRVIFIFMLMIEKMKNIRYTMNNMNLNNKLHETRHKYKVNTRKESERDSIVKLSASISEVKVKTQHTTTQHLPKP